MRKSDKIAKTILSEELFRKFSLFPDDSIALEIANELHKLEIKITKPPSTGIAEYFKTKTYKELEIIRNRIKENGLSERSIGLFTSVDNIFIELTIDEIFTKMHCILSMYNYQENKGESYE